MKKRLIIIIAVIAVIVILLCVKGNELSINSEEQRIEVNQNFTNLLQTSFAESGEADTIGGEIVKTIFQMTEYEVISVDGDVCQVQITYPDAAGKFSTIAIAMHVAYSDETQYEAGSAALLETLLAELQSGSVTMITKTISTRIVDGVPEVDEEMLDAFYGGLLSLFNEELEKAYQHKVEQEG